MVKQTIFQREERSEILFDKILADPWACEKLKDTFCRSYKIPAQSANMRMCGD